MKCIKKNSNFYKKAFSLIEISVVIIVVGILLAGISSGIDFYDDYKLKVVQNLTKNSRVARIKDLELWLETTSENSFALGTTSFVDKIAPNELDPIGRWNDANPNILPTARNSATQATLDSQPKYIRKGINGFPALLFDGTNDYITSEAKFIIVHPSSQTNFFCKINFSRSFVFQRLMRSLMIIKLYKIH
jgi:prepilin-type N-terminal cleavage/methylation domain-containing protein